MTTGVNFNLFFLGNDRVGKTTLIRAITQNKDRQFNDSSQSVAISDWTIKFNNREINVEIKEGSNLKDSLLRSLVRRQGNNAIINIILKINKQTNDIEELSWLDTIQYQITSETIVIVTLNHDDFKIEETIDLLKFKKKYRFVRYWVKMPIFSKDGNDAFREFEFLLRQIIINKCSDRLDYVKNLILKNKTEKNKTLDLGNCDITSLHEIKELFDCEHLETLILSNEWGEFSKGEWVRKESSNKNGSNILYDLPKDIQKFKHLNTLICGGNWKGKKRKNISGGSWHIDDISVLSALKNLKILNVSNNDITTVGRINKLTNLVKLYLNNNRITKVPSIANMNFLREIYLSNNELEDVGFLENLKGVKTIDIHSNLIKNLLPLNRLITELNIKDSKWETNTISVLKNPLDIPAPSVVSKGKNAVLAYFRQLEAEQSIKLKPFKNKDIKLILVGNSNVGKSTLVHWLKNARINKGIATTHWMNIEKWEAKHEEKEYNVKIFDFGGQEYYHDTHHLFFTNRTAYVVLWDEKSNRFDEILIEQRQLDKTIKVVGIQTFPLQYWLDSISFHTNRRIKTLGEKKIEKLLEEKDVSIEEPINSEMDSAKHVYSSTSEGNNVQKNEENILIVQNKVDTHKDKTFLNEKTLKENHDKVYDFAAISIFNKKGLAVLKSKMFDIFNSLDIINQECLGTWGFIKEKIEQESFLQPYYLTEFKNYCNENIREIPEIIGKSKSQIQKVLFDDQDAEVFAEYLADIGIALYYPENYNLKSKIFLNQEHILSSIYKILLGLDSKNGEFSKEDLIIVLGKNSIDQDIEDLIDLMIHFKIIFQHPSKKNSYIAPLYLPKEPPQGAKLFSSLFARPVYRYRYKTFIYKNVILDFFNQHGEKALRETANKDLYYYWREGIVVKDEVSGEIVMVKFYPGNNMEQYAFVDVYTIQASMDDSFVNTIIKDLDKINEGWGVLKSVATNDGNFVPLEVIHKNEEDDNWVFLFEKKYYKLADFKKHLIKPIKMKKIFISYSKQDLGLVNKFIEHLSALQLDGKVSHWYCSELKPGSEWDKEIQKHLDEADIACFMISPNFMKTSYIHEHEISKAFEKKANVPNFRIVPIILDFCRWATTKNNLGQLTALPYTAKPVLDFANENMAWYIIQECLRLMIDQNLNPTGDNFYMNQQLPSDVLKIYKRIVGDKVDKNTN